MEEKQRYHLFLHCQVTTQLWQLFMNMIALQWVMPRSTGDLLRCCTESESGIKSYYGGLLDQHAYHGLFGPRETEYFLKTMLTPFSRKRPIGVFLVCCFCRMEYVNEAEIVLQVLESLQDQWRYFVLFFC